MSGLMARVEAMQDREWVQIRSWHAVLTPTRVPNRYRTLCGRTAEGQAFHTLPVAKSCETCLRLIARQADKP
jgi:hypothetical protein